MTEAGGILRARPLARAITDAPSGGPGRGTSADAWNLAASWNIAVRTRGVFTHRDDFQKPACVERGLVRTVIGSDQAAVPRFLTITQFPKKSIRS